MENNKRTWVNPYTGEKVTVEIDSPEDKEYMAALDAMGLTTDTGENTTPFLNTDEWWKKQREESIERMRRKLKEQQDGTGT